jgi:hypothetical protein
MFRETDHGDAEFTEGPSRDCLTCGFLDRREDSLGWKAGKTITTETLRARERNGFEENLPFSVISVSLWSEIGFWGAASRADLRG